MIFVLILGALTVFVAAPLYRGARPPDPSAELEARRDVLVAELRELELDRATGGLDHATFCLSRARLETEAADVLRRLAD